METYSVIKRTEAERLKLSGARVGSRVHNVVSDFKNGLQTSQVSKCNSGSGWEWQEGKSYSLTMSVSD